MVETAISVPEEGGEKELLQKKLAALQEAQGRPYSEAPDEVLRVFGSEVEWRDFIGRQMKEVQAALNRLNN